MTRSTCADESLIGPAVLLSTCPVSVRVRSPDHRSQRPISNSSASYVICRAVAPSVRTGTEARSLKLSNVREATTKLRSCFRREGRPRLSTLSITDLGGSYDGSLAPRPDAVSIQLSLPRQNSHSLRWFWDVISSSVFVLARSNSVETAI